jgi:glycosyltransferase involved in cell wall biosynthesis
MEHTDMSDVPAILQVNTERTWRGGEQQMLYLARGLHEREIRTAVCCQPGSPCAERVQEAGLKCHELRMRGEWDLPAGMLLARLFRRGDFDVIHAHTPHAHALAIMATARLGRKPRVVVHRRVDFHIRPRFFRLGSVKYRLGVDRIIAISRPVKKILIEDGVPAGTIEIIHSAVDPGRFEGITPDPGLREELGVPEEAVLVLNVGYLVGHKAHEYLIRAAPSVIERVPDAWFVIAGSGPRLEELQQEAQRAGVSERVVFAGFREDVPQLLREADIFAVSSWGEGLCSSLLEAMASELPIVATTAGGITDVIRDGDNGLLVPPRDPEALAGAIVRVATQPGLGETFARRGREVMEDEFSAEVLVERTLDLYRRLVGEGNL